MYSKPDVVVVTGATAGVGRATVRAFAEQGCDIGLIARDTERLDDTKREVETLGGRAIAVSADVANSDELFTALKTIEEEFGPVDIWINNAMTSVFAPVKDTTPEEFKRVTEVTYLGYVHGTMAALSSMLARDKGVIIQVGSALSYRGIPLQAAYCGAKHAIKGFTESLLSELIHDQSNVQIRMVHLPAINTPQFDWVRSKMPRNTQPLPPIFQPEVAAEAIYYTAYNDKREFLVAGPTLETVLGNKVAPSFLDTILAKIGYKNQMTHEPMEGSYREGNLWEPVKGVFAAHGRFDEEAKSSSWQVWLEKHKDLIALGGLISIAGALAVKNLFSSDDNH